MRYYMRQFIKQVYLITRYIFLFPFLLFRKTISPEEENIKKILVLRYDRIGDMVLSTGAFKALRQKFPAAFITVLASERNKELIENDPHIDEILVYRGRHAFLKELKPRRIDLGIDLFHTYELGSALLAYLCRIRYRLGFEIWGRQVFFNIRGPDMSGNYTMGQHTLRLLSCLGIDTKDCSPKLYLLDEEMEWAKGFLSSLKISSKDLKIAIHPGGFYPSQRWPADRFAGAGKKIIEKFGINIILLGDKSEEGLLKEIKQKINTDKVSILCELSLRQIISVLNECNLLICNNSGILHIACALNVPTVSTMGPTDPALWWPQGENHIVLKKELACRPCNRAICGKHTCLDLITVEDVLGAVEIQLYKIKKRQDADTRF